MKNNPAITIWLVILIGLAVNSLHNVGLMPTESTPALSKSAPTVNFLVDSQSSEKHQLVGTTGV